MTGSRSQRAERARLEQEQLEREREDVAIVERNLAIIGSAVATGAVCHLAFFLMVVQHASGIAMLFDPSRFLAYVAWGYLTAAALRVLAAVNLWWSDQSGRVLYLISVCATFIGTGMLVWSNPSISLFLLSLFPPLVILTALFRGPIAELLTDQRFATVVKVSTQTKRPHDGPFWAAHVVLLLLSGVAVAVGYYAMT